MSVEANSCKGGSTLAKFNEFLYDDIGNEYQRKNLYLLEVAQLQKRIEDEDKFSRESLKAQLKDLIKRKTEHPYNIQLKEFQLKEKEFLKKLSNQKKSLLSSMDKNTPKKLKSLEVQLFKAKAKLDFYKQYVDLTYDAQLAYEESKMYLKHVPEIIKNYKENKTELEKALIESKNISKQEKEKKEQVKAEFERFKTEQSMLLEVELDNLRSLQKNGDISDKELNERGRKLKKEFKQAIKIKSMSDFKRFKLEQKKVLNDGYKRLKLKKRQGAISSKALKNGEIELKQKYKSALKLKSYESPKKANKELIENKRYEIKTGTKRMERVLKADIADIRRKTPMEVVKSTPKFAYTTFLLPGLGQILNKQYEKGIMFLLASLFTYLMAIPYALGYGNYQGDGIAGLMSLAQGGPRIYKSLIFLIEGVIALFLVIIAIALLYFSFRDVLKVEKDKIKGIRPKNWFELKNTISQDGFPYLVSTPALFVIIFIVLVPITTTLLLSIAGMTPTTQSKFDWVAFENYKRLILGQGLAGSVFWRIFGWTVIWTLVATTLAIVIGFFLAILANNERVIGKKIFRAIYLLPWAVPSFITIMFFSIMFAPRGMLTGMLTNLVGSTSPIIVKNSAILTRVTLILLQGWLGSAYVFLLSTGVLQAIPEDLYEAAEMDGATSWQKTMRITIPIVLFQTAPLLVTQYTFNFNNFSIIYLFNGGGPFNPLRYGNLAGSSDLLISYIYKLTMDNQYQSIGAAITIFISLGLMFFAFVGFKNSKAFKEERL